MRDRELLKVQWDRFITKNEIDPALDDVVKQSWLRSVSYGVNPLQKTGEACISRNELESRLMKKDDLLQFSIPLMESLYTLVQGSGFLVILCDEEGFLLKVKGDSNTLSDAQKMNFKEGFSWSEKAMGTNAIGTCITLDRPLQIYAGEHFSRICQTWTCSASPIHDPEGNVIGVLNMSGPFDKVHPHTLGMVVSAVLAIENQFRLKEKTQKNEIMQSYLEATINTLPEGVFIVTREGTIIRTNEMLLNTVGLDENNMLGRRMDQVFEHESLRNMIAAETEILDKEIDLMVKTSREMRHVLLNAKPIRSSAGELMGSLISMKEIKKVRQFINELTGSQAKYSFANIIGNSSCLAACKNEAKLAAVSHSTVLLLGESGTGKDLFAQAVHNESDRRNKPFIAINCGAISRDLLGSELFGYVEGAFTGAKKGGSVGKFEMADGGTLFLDEIGEMSLEMQVLLLRVLQEKEVVRIGGHKVIPVDVRIIAATNKNLEEEVRKGTFRKDLYYRLNVISIKIPSLRKRKEDIELLVRNFTQQLNGRLNKRIKFISPALFEILERYDWPGNVRELQNVLERTIVRSTGETLLPEFLPDELRVELVSETNKDSLPLKEDVKKQALIRSIQESTGNFKAAARNLGISRSTLYRQLKKYNLQ